MDLESRKYSREEKREIRNTFFKLLNEAWVTKQDFEDFWNFMHPPKKRPVAASEAAARCLAEVYYVPELAISKIEADLQQLRIDFGEDNGEWERFILYLSHGFAKYNKKIRAEFISLLGSQGMRELFLGDFRKFSHNKRLLFSKYEEAYSSWYFQYQDRLRKEMDKNIFIDDVARPQSTYHINSLPLEFVHPRDLVELDLPEPKKNRGYRFPLSGF